MHHVEIRPIIFVLEGGFRVYTLSLNSLSHISPKPWTVLREREGGHSGCQLEGCLGFAMAFSVRGCRVLVLGLGCKSLEFKVWGLKGLGFRVLVLGLGCKSLEFGG